MTAFKYFSQIVPKLRQNKIVLCINLLYTARNRLQTGIPFFYSSLFMFSSVGANPCCVLARNFDLISLTRNFHANKDANRLTLGKLCHKNCPVHKFAADFLPYIADLCTGQFLWHNLPTVNRLASLLA